MEKPLPFMPVHQARETGHSPQVREKPAGKTHQPEGWGAGEATGGAIASVTSSPRSRDLWRKAVMWGEEFQNPPTFWVASYIYQWIRKIMCIAKTKRKKKEEISYCKCTDIKGIVWWVRASVHNRVTTNLIKMYISMTPEYSLRPLSSDSPPEVAKALSWFLSPQPSFLCSRTPNTLNHAVCILL